MPEQNDITSNLDLLLQTLPQHLRDSLAATNESPDALLEIVMDLGRLPEARYRHTSVLLGQQEITFTDIETVTGAISAFGEDNRAGIPRTLHRISCIRNRSGRIVGLTCRVGRAVHGTISIIRDLVESGKSVLLLGRPGVGKTTMLRETARVLADDIIKRVVIVDTSNEIAGDGDIPHAGIGRARRMQVQRPSEQHAVMIEAVENHMPEVIVIDEIGTELEAQASRTIAERGVQLIGTAHGQLLENLMVNPTLSDLIGGIQAVTLGDDEARRRGTQKTVLERKQPPTFDVLVEIRSWEDVLVYTNIAEAVDALLHGELPDAEHRSRNASGEITIEIVTPEPPEGLAGQQAWGVRRAHTMGGMDFDTRHDRHDRHGRTPQRRQLGTERFQRDTVATPMPASNTVAPASSAAAVAVAPAPAPTQRIYAFGLSRDKIDKAIVHLKLARPVSRQRADFAHPGIDHRLTRFVQHLRIELYLAIVGIGIGPEPLVSGDLDGQGISRCRFELLGQKIDRGNGDTDQDQHGHQRPYDFDQRVVAVLRRDRIGPAVIAGHHPQQQEQHEQADDRDDRQKHAIVHPQSIFTERRILRLEIDPLINRHALARRRHHRRPCRSSSRGGGGSRVSRGRTGSGVLRHKRLRHSHEGDRQ